MMNAFSGLTGLVTRLPTCFINRQRIEEPGRVFSDKHKEVDVHLNFLPLGILVELELPRRETIMGLDGFWD
jgi:hypothetical protein